MCHTLLPSSPEAPLQVFVSVQTQLRRNLLNWASQENISLQQSGWREELSEEKEEQAEIIKGKRMGMILQMDVKVFLRSSLLSCAGGKLVLSLCRDSRGLVTLS